MRLQKYLLKEARVKKTDADIFLKKFAPIFMWSPEEGLLWAVNPNKNNKDWWVYKNSKIIKKDLEGYQYKDYFKGKAFAHYELADVMSVNVGEKFIRGRISPDGENIYVHTLSSRNHIGMNKKIYDKMVDKAINAVYKYMKEYIR